MPTLLPDTEIGELLSVVDVLEFAEMYGTFPTVPVPLLATVCAAALTVNAAMPIAIAAIFLCMVLIPSFLAGFASGETRFATAPARLLARELYGAGDR